MLATLLLSILHAPAPLPKAAPPPPKISAEALLGEWDCRWNTVPCTMVFKKGGVYGHDWRGEPYYGSWSLEGTTLHIEEQTYDGGPRCKWRIELSGPHQGMIATPAGAPAGVPFSLHPRGTLLKTPDSERR